MDRLGGRPLVGGRPLGAWCALLFVALCAGGFAIMQLESNERAATEERLVAARATELRAELGDQLTTSVSLARGLRAYVRSDPSLGDEAQLTIVLEELYEQGEHIHHIGVAPDNVVRSLYPIEGNEAVIGLRYEEVPEQYSAIEWAMESGETVLAGPVGLVQGGRGLVDLDVEWALRTVENGIQPATPVAGDQALFDDADTVLSLAVPNNTWELAVRGDVTPLDALVNDIARALIVIGAAAISWLVYSALMQRRQARALSLRDDLTGLANRRCLEERIERALARSRREGVPTALLYVDLDAFKAVNDAHGHRAGDHVLRTGPNGCTIGPRARHGRAHRRRRVRRAHARHGRRRRGTTGRGPRRAGGPSRAEWHHSPAVGPRFFLA